MSRASPDAAEPSPEVYYPCKWVLSDTGASVPICMQAQNGPCALLALFNVSLQTRAITLEPGTTRLREDLIMALLADNVSRPQSPAGSEALLLREHAVSDFLDLLPRLNRGMDINVRFSSPTAFEFTRELSAFDVFPSLRLVHGWLVDPQDARLADALGTLTYNQVIDELVRTISPSPPAEVGPPVDEADLAAPPEPSAPPIEAFEAPAKPSEEDTPGDSESIHTAKIRDVRPFVMDFLESNPTQLTVYGLTELHSTLAEGEITILFRNSHFYVIRKRNGELFTLVTDVGYLNELNTVWEKLGDINGDSTFYTGSFDPLTSSGGVTTSAAQSSSQVPSNAPPPPPLQHARTAPCPPASQHAASSVAGSSIGTRPYQPARASSTRPSRKDCSNAGKGKNAKSQDCVVQ